MSNANQSNAPAVDAGSVPGDIVGGAVLTVLAAAHLFVLGVAGMPGIVLLFVVWPLVGGAAAAAVAGSQSVDDGRTMGLNGAVAGVFGTIAVTLLTLLTGFVGAWPDFISTQFGSELAPVVIAMGMAFAITWTVFGYVGGYAVRVVTDRE